RVTSQLPDSFLFLFILCQPIFTLFPYTTLFRSEMDEVPIGAIIVHQDELIAAGYNIRETTQSALCHAELIAIKEANEKLGSWRLDRKSTRLNSSHVSISYAVFCLKKKR